MIRKFRDWKIKKKMVRMADNTSHSTSFSEAIHSRPELWDKKHPDFNDKDTQKGSWKAIADEFLMTSEEAEAKYKQLKDSVNGDYKRRKREFESDVKQPLYEAIKFALSDSSPQSHSSREYPPNKAENAVTENAVEITVAIPARKEQSRIKEKITPAKYTSTPEQVNKRKNQSQQHSNKSTGQETTIEFCKGYPRSKCHKVSGFIQHVSNKLNSYDPFTRSNVEFHICKLLYEADMRTLDQHLLMSSSASEKIADSPLGSLGSLTGHKVVEVITSTEESSAFPSASSSAYNTEVIIKPDGFLI